MIVDVLRAYAREPEPRTDAAKDRVMRALMEHRGYLVPVGWLASKGISESEKLCLFSQTGGPAPGEHWVFTDEERAHFANAKMVGRGEPGLGTWGMPFDGVTVFAGLDPRLLKVKVNPNTELETFWFIPQESIKFAGLWASAIAVERALADLSAPGALRCVQVFGGFQILVLPNNAIATATNAAGFANAAMIFTGPDCAARVASQQAGLRTVTVDGARLFDWLTTQRVDGILINPLGPGPVIRLELEVCKRVTGAG